jgi:nicotinamidase-related amidase
VIVLPAAGTVVAAVMDRLLCWAEFIINVIIPVWDTPIKETRTMLLDADRSALIVVDVQERLAPVIHEIDHVVHNIGILMQAAARVGVPMLVTEQYPKGLGHSIQAVAALAPARTVVEKIEFSAAENPDFNRRLAAIDRPQVLVCGIETHVCVLQTVLQLADRTISPFVVRDACGSRRPENAAAAVSRAERHGIEPVTTEMVVFEWMRRADSPVFRELSRLIK